MLKRLNTLGPGILVAAAFIGPGTVTACTLAGANFGYTLLWALLFATLATIVLQEMSARLGTITQQGLGDALYSAFQGSIFKWPLITIILLAIFGGNAAYEAGNLAGAAIGVEALTGSNPWVVKLSIIAVASFGLFVLWRGSYAAIERILIALVMVMCLAFLLTFFVVRPDLLSMLNGVTRPQIPQGSLMTVVALIGTTVVPYNLFLHAAAAKSRWQGAADLSAARTDTVLSIGLGGIVAILIASTAAASIYAQALSVQNAADMALQFEPLFGSLSKYLLGIGLFAAGLSSAITAPLATGYAVTEILQIKGGVKSSAFRLISSSIILIGASLAVTDIKPLKLIVMAQFTNGLILPIVACFLLYALNQRKILGDYANGHLANSLGTIVVLLTAALGARSIMASLNFL